MAHCEVIENFGPNLITLYQRIYRIGFVAGRHIWQYSYVKILENGTFVMITNSIPQEENTYPQEATGLVEMDIRIGGLIIEPIDGGQRSKVTFIIEGGLGGSIPNWVTKQAIGIQAYTLSQLRKLLPDFIKKNKAEFDKRPIIR